MYTAWFVISIILAIVWFIVFVVGTCFGLFNSDVVDADERKEFFRYFSAVMAGAAIFVVAHWIVLVLAIPVFILYGLWSGVRLLVTRPWKEEAQ